MIKRIIVLLMVVTLLIPNFVMANNGSEIISSVAGSPITSVEVDRTINEAGTQVSNFAELVLRQVADKSTPICALLLIYGAVLYFIMGIRNLYRKRQGMLMMWGSLTFWVIAQVAYVVFWLLGTKL